MIAAAPVDRPKEYLRQCLRYYRLRRYYYRWSHEGEHSQPRCHTHFARTGSVKNRRSVQKRYHLLQS